MTSRGASPLAPREVLDIRREAARVRPDDPEAWALLSAAYTAVGQRAQALHAKRLAIEARIGQLYPIERYLRGPELAVPLQHLSEAFLDEGLLDDALDTFRRATEVAQVCGASLNYARVLTRLDRHEDAVAEYQAIARRWPCAEGLAELGQALHRLGRNASALSALRRAYNLDPNWLAEHPDSESLFLELLGHAVAIGA